MDIQQWPCPACGDDREFVQPPCADGHTEEGGSCPEWTCVDCGSAFVTAVPQDVREHVPFVVAA